MALVCAVIYTLAKMIPNVYVSSVVPTSGSFFVAPTKLIHPIVGMAKNESLAVLHATLDFRRIIDVPGYDRIELAPCTRFIATMYRAPDEYTAKLDEYIKEYVG